MGMINVHTVMIFIHGFFIAWTISRIKIFELKIKLLEKDIKNK